jgi:hypothetical protein
MPSLQRKSRCVRCLPNSRPPYRYGFQYLSSFAIIANGGTSCISFRHPHSRDYSYSTICQALEVDLLSEDSHFRAFETTYNAREPIRCKMSAASTADNLLAPDGSPVGGEQSTWIGHDSMSGSEDGTATTGSTLTLPEIWSVHLPSPVALPPIAHQIDEGEKAGNTDTNTPSTHSHEESRIHLAKRRKVSSTWLNADVDEMNILDIPSDDPFWAQATLDSPLFQNNLHI